MYSNLNRHGLQDVSRGIWQKKPKKLLNQVFLSSENMDCKGYVDNFSECGALAPLSYLTACRQAALFFVTSCALYQAALDGLSDSNLEKSESFALALRHAPLLQPQIRERIRLDFVRERRPCNIEFRRLGNDFLRLVEGVAIRVLFGRQNGFFYFEFRLA